MHFESKQPRRDFLIGGAFLLACLLPFVPAARAQENAELEGTWAGSIEPGMGAPALGRISFTFTRDASGELTGIADSDESTTSIPIDRVTLEGSALRVELSQVDAVYEGTWVKSAPAITGQLTQGGATFTVNLAPGASVKPIRPQEPQAPFPYVQEQVGYEDAATGVHFAGTLTKPRSFRRFPAVLLITGSGSQNRDEEIYAHKPFLLIADTLTRRGIAVLRVDDRGVGGTTGDALTATTQDLIGDALAGVAYLKSRRDIDASRIGLIGHSEGGIIAPAVAVRADIAFIALLAGPGVRGDDLLIRQVERLSSAENPADFTRFWVSVYRQLVDIVLAESDDTLARQQMEALIQQKKAEAAASNELSDETKALIAASEDAARQNAEQLLMPWMRYFLAYDPQPALREVQCPVLALNGDLDLQVDSKQNLPAIAAALAEAGNDEATITELPGLNHLFQTANTGAPGEYAELEETFAPSALQLLSEWVVKQALGR
jgi:pimeloyl-ACP methyl ester carboxylesterase